MELPSQNGTGVDAGAATATGPRPDNQDRVAVAPGWAIVSDGVGGHAGGGRAAQLTVDTVIATLEAAGSPSPEVLERAVAAANEAVRAGRRADPEVADMGATLTVAVVAAMGPDESRWLIASVGDSPAWVVRADAPGADLVGGVPPAGASVGGGPAGDGPDRNGGADHAPGGGAPDGAGPAGDGGASGPSEAVRLTEDHTIAAELMRSGALSPEEAARHPGRHVIFRSIGAEDVVEPDITEVTLRPGDALVIVSDGVGDAVTPADIHEITMAAATADEAAQRLVTAALDRGATDNSTAAVVRHPGRPGGAG
ncbi:MAG TPA: PP2C family serine/threonine-protein phosphatase [Acidimicrobiales bacterium]